MLFRARPAVRTNLAVIRSSQRHYSSPPPPHRPSPHSQWYTNTLPAMIPIFLLGSAVYLGLQLTQQKLSHEKYMQEAHERVRQLEAQLSALEEERLKALQKGPQPSSPEPHPAKPPSRSRWW